MSEFEIDVEELRDGVRKLLSTESDSHTVRSIIEGDAARRDALWQQVAELGWLGLAIDEAYGGLAQGPAQLGVLYEELGRHLTPLPIVSTVLVAQAIQLAGTEEQKQAWLESIATGERSATTSFAAGAALEVSELAEGATVSGRLPAVVDADLVYLLLLPVRSAKGEQALLLVERNNPQLKVEWKPSVDETRRLCDVQVEDLIITSDNLLPLTAEQQAIVTNRLCLAIACDSVGGAARILEETVEYMKTREQFGRPIGSFQALKHRCATWKILQEAASALCGQAVLAEGEVWASRAKYYSCDAYSAIAGDAIQLHGGIGFTWEHDCHLYFKRAKLNQVLLGDSAAHKDSIARQVFN